MNHSLMKKLADYKPSATARELVAKTPILLLVGPTGAGKDSVKEHLLKSGRFYHIVSYTTRPLRINHGLIEQDGVDYHFIDEQKANEMLEAHEFIEVKAYSGNFYGTGIKEIQEAHNQGKVATTDLEVQGVAEYKRLNPKIMAVFLLPPDFKTWQARLQRRYGDVVDAVDYRRRLETALWELEQLLKMDYYVPVVNDDLSKTVRQIKNIVNSPAGSTDDTKAAHKVAQKLAKDIQASLNNSR